MPHLSRLVLLGLSIASVDAEEHGMAIESAMQTARELAVRHVAQVVELSGESAGALIVENEQNLLADGTPVVMMHGMGDFARNPMGMEPLRKLISKEANAYVHSVEICSTRVSGCPIEDQADGFLMSMDEQTDRFAAAVRSDTKLASGFNAVGMSQGNSIIRAYVHRYNDPPVKSFLSMHGTMMGVAGLPRCPLDVTGLDLICKTVDELIGLGVYAELVQKHLAQANYFRDPKKLETYRKHGLFLPDINNEAAGGKKNKTYADNFRSLEKLVLVMAEDDEMIHPKESEHFGFFKDGSLSELVAMRDAPWYTEDWFGLKALDAAGKVDFHSTPGDHLRFTTSFLAEMVRKYFVRPATASIQV